MNYYVTISLTEEQIKELKIKAIEEKKTIKQLVKELIINKLEEKCSLQ